VINLKNKKICLVSYVHSSGLHYLAKYFYDELSKYNDVTWIPKIKYKLKNSRYVRLIERSKDLKMPNSVRFLNIDEYDKFFSKNKFDYIFSFETNLREKWVVKNIEKITDIPMIEWVDFNKINYYKHFKEILCLNNFTFNSLKNHGNCKKFEFKIKSKNCQNKRGYFYHQASLNPEYSSKNTDAVISAFLNTNKKLIVTGLLSDYNLSKINNNIKYFGVLSRDKIEEIYCSSEFLIAPSKIEGFGLQIYEAKSYGCKILCSDYPTIKDLGDYIVSLDSQEPISSQIYDIITNLS